MNNRLSLVLGGVRSGKSEFGEELAGEEGKPVLYVATGVASDPEMNQRIQCHRESRPDDWKTLEAPIDLDGALDKALNAADAPEVVLVDSLDSWIGNLSKTFLKAMREVDGEDTKYHLHCLRHTFAVRRYLKTKDIYLVKQEMGHASVTTTEVYAQFSLRRLEMDFPSLVELTENGKNRELGYRNLGYKQEFIDDRAVFF